MLHKHLDEAQLAALDAGNPGREEKQHFETCAECRSRVAEARVLRAALVGSAGIRKVKVHQRPASHPEPEVLAAYVDGSLVGASALSVEEHVSACDVCSGDVVAMHHVPAALASDEVSGDDAIKRLLQRLSAKAKLVPPESLGRWLVALSDKMGAAFAPMVQKSEAAAALSDQASSLEETGRRVLARLRASVADLHQAFEEAARLMRQSVDIMRKSGEHWDTEIDAIRKIHADLQRQSDEMLTFNDRFLSSFQSSLEALQAVTRDTERPPAGAESVLECEVADLRLRIEGRDPKRQQVLTVTMSTREGQPAEGIEIEANTTDGGTIVRRTDRAGNALFELDRRTSRLRVLHHGVWELELTRLR